MQTKLNHIEEKVEKLDEKLDKVSERLNSIDITLAVNTESLVEHIKRTNLLEAELKPVSKHVIMMETGFKIVGIICSVLAFLAGVVKVFF